jgi:putative chitinase
MITRDMLKRIAPNSKEEIIAPLVQHLNNYMPKYEVNTYLRVCHFISQSAHESASFRTLEEYASGSAYEGRKGLGNTQKGDGVKYKGRGIFQLTGRANYRTIGAKIGKDLENNPRLAATHEISVLTALEYWKSRNLNKWADEDNVERITRLINGGLNGFEDRKKYLARCKQVIPRNFSFNGTVQPQQPADNTTPQPPINPLIPAIVVAKRGDNSPYIKDLQEMLIRKGAKITADGAFGPMTETAVIEFQTKNKLKVTGQIDTDTLNRMMV